LRTNQDPLRAGPSRPVRPICCPARSCFTTLAVVSYVPWRCSRDEAPCAGSSTPCHTVPALASRYLPSIWTTNGGPTPRNEPVRQPAERLPVSRAQVRPSSLKQSRNEYIFAGEFTNGRVSGWLSSGLDAVSGVEDVLQLHDLRMKPGHRPQYERDYRQSALADPSNAANHQHQERKRVEHPTSSMMQWASTPIPARLNSHQR
jgi:hypothetical protein